MQPYPFSCCSVVLSFRSRGSLQLRKAIGLGYKQVKMVRTSVTVSFIINTVYSWFESFWSKEKFSKKGQSVYSCSSKALLISQVLHHHHLIIYPLTARVVGAPQMILQPVSSIFPCSHCPLGLGELKACPFPDVVFPPLYLSALSSSPFHCALQDGFGQTWWTGDMTIQLQFASLYNGQEVFMWSNCLLDLGTDFLVGKMVCV